MSYFLQTTGRLVGELVKARVTSTTMVQALLWLGAEERDGCTMTDLARACGVTSAAMTACVDRLVCLGLAVRRAKPYDRRVHVVTLTTQGEALVFAAVLAAKEGGAA